MSQILSDYGHLIGTDNGSIQVTEMPIYSTVPLGTTVQYIGTTTSNYTNSYFYKRETNGWIRVDVQPGPTLGTAAAKNFTTQISSGSTEDLPTAGAVNDAIESAISSAYHAAGTKTVAELTSSLLIAANEGNVYNMTDSGTTTADFIEGQGKPINEGDNVGVAKVGSVYKFDLLSGFVDLTNYVQKSTTSGLLKNDGSVDTTIIGAVSANTSAIAGIKDGTSIDSFGDVETALADKVDKVTGKGLSTNDYTDEDKEKVDKIDDIEEIIEAIKDYTGYKDVLGLEVDYENKSFKRLASADGLEAGTDFNAFRMYSGMRRCNLDADGNVTAYRGEDGYSESQNTMVEIPYFYYRMEPLKLKKETKGYSVKKARYYISENPHPGFKLFPAFEIDGRILDTIYYSAFNGSLYDTSESAYLLEDEQVMDATVDKLVSIIGAKPASGVTQNLTKANLEIMAQNLGSGYHVSDIYAEMAVTWLMLIEYGVHDFQRTKLGYGVVNKSSGSGNESVKNGLATNLDETGSTFVKDTTGLVSICYRWIENPYGNIWNNVQAVNIWGDGTMQGGEYFICTDGNYNESKHDDNYEGVGFYLPAANTYISAFGYGKEKFDWLLLPSEATGADNALPVGDHVWSTANLNAYKIALLGANWNNGLNAGRSSWGCNPGVGFRRRDIGGRLVYRKLRR